MELSRRQRGPCPRRQRYALLPGRWHACVPMVCVCREVEARHTGWGRRYHRVEFLGLSRACRLPLTPARSPPHSSALLSRSLPNGGRRCAEDFAGGVSRSGNLDVSNARLNQQLKVMALEAGDG